MRNFWKILWYLTLIGLLYQILFLYPELPERMASHFDFSGKADGWSDKGSFLIIWIAAIILVNIWLPLTEKMIRKFPALVNVPDKKYWYADSKRIDELCHRVYTMMAMIFGPINLIFIYAFQYTYDINTAGSSQLSLSLIFIPIVFITVYPVIYILTRLRAPSEYQR